LPDGYVRYVVPADDSTGVPLDTTILVQFTQPMKYGGGGGSASSPTSYELYQLLDPKRKVTISQAVYDPATSSTVLVLNNADVDWVKMTWYELRIKRTLQNVCGKEPLREVFTQFMTEGG
jgi:hypothetical protein